MGAHFMRNAELDDNRAFMAGVCGQAPLFSNKQKMGGEKLNSEILFR